MHVSQLGFVFDCVTDEEMKEFQTENITFSRSETSPLTSSHKITKVFRFNVKEEFEIIFFLEGAKDRISEQFFVQFEFGCYLNNNWTSEFDKFLLPYYLEDIQPIVLFLEQKKEEIRKIMENNKTLRFFKLLEGIKVPTVYNHTLKNYERLKSFKHSSTFASEQKRIRNEFGKLGITFP